MNAPPKAERAAASQKGEVPQKGERRARFVARVNAEHRAAWQAEKKQAQEAQRKRREQGLEDRRAQTTALMALAMGVVSRMQESEREPEFFRENDET